MVGVTKGHLYVNARAMALLSGSTRPSNYSTMYAYVLSHSSYGQNYKVVGPEAS